jgi:Flp pilus assembly protein TadD
MANFRAGHTVEAIAYLRKGVALNPGDARYHFGLGMVLKAQGDVRAARQEFAAALALDPSLSDAREQIAEIDRQQPAKQVQRP